MVLVFSTPGFVLRARLLLDLRGVQKGKSTVSQYLTMLCFVDVVKAPATKAVGAVPSPWHASSDSSEH